MSTLGNFIELEAQKSMIRHILKSSQLDFEEDEMMEMVEDVQKKLLAMRVHREYLRIKEQDSLAKVSEDNEADPEAVLDSFVYFSLILENVWLKKQLSKWVVLDED